MKKMAGTADTLAGVTVAFPESSQTPEQFEGRTPPPPPPPPPPRVTMLPTPIQKAVARPGSRLFWETENCC